MRGSSHGAVISGIGESEFSRRSGVPFETLQLGAAQDALRNANLCVSDIDTLFTDCAIMPNLLAPDRLQSQLSLDAADTIACVSLGGAGISNALGLAADRIEMGVSDAALIYFGVDWGTSPGGPYALHSRYRAKAAYEFPVGLFGQPTYFSLLARRYASNHDIDLSLMRRALGQLAVDERANALKNPGAQVSKSLSLEDYHDSRTISSPLCLYDCCLVSDGAAALVVTSDELARRRGAGPRVRVIGWGRGYVAADEENFFTQNASFPRMDPAATSSQRAYAKAGIAAADLDFAQIYDCFTMAVLLQLEEMGFARPGEGIQMLLAGSAVGESDLPINTHGGCLSHAYILGITHITEAVKELRWDGGPRQVLRAEIAAVGMAPGHDHTTVILARD
jgi:acetyl-CoA acetyltransferase